MIQVALVIVSANQAIETEFPIIDVGKYMRFRQLIYGSDVW